ncbi:MAG TPA: DUF1684 domain-containing protein [Thermoanaerobaculia bacterium]
MSPAPAPDAAAYRQEIERFRADRIAELKDDQGWLTLVGLFWLEPGENKFGSDPADAVVLPEGKAPAVAGTLVRDGRTVTVKVAPGVAVTSGGKSVTTLTLADDTKGDPTVLELGTLRFHLVTRIDRVGVRVKDSKSAVYTSFHGLDNFPIQPDWRVVARWERSRPPKKLQITNVLGMVDEEVSTGAVVFERDGQTYRLDALQHPDGTMLIIFGDGTNGHETYNAGRFLEAVAPKDGQVVVDFNKAYNPPCAFTPYATCPLPPPENKLALRIPAGEKKYGSGTH